MAIQKKLDVVISAVDEFSGTMGQFGLSFGKVGAALVAAEAALIAFSIAAAKVSITLGKDLFDSAVDFHDAIYDITAVAKSFGTTSDQVSKVLDDLVVKFPLTGKQAGDALQLIAQMGYGTEEQMRRMADAATTLSIATGVDVRTAAEATMATMNAFGMSIEETDRVINTFAQASFTSAAGVSELKEAMKYAAPIASSAGMSFEETVAAVAKLKDIGLEASQAGTTLRMALSQLMKQTEQGEAALKRYGLTYADVNPEVNSLAEIIGKFEGHTLGAKDAVDIFGVRAMTMNKIISAGKDAFQSYNDKITDSTAAYDALEEKMKKWSVVQDMILGDLDVMKKTMAGDLVPAVAELVGYSEDDGIRGIVTGLKRLEEVEGKIGKNLLETLNSLKKAFGEAFRDSFGDVEGLYNWIDKIAEVLSTNLEILGIWGAEFAKIFVEETDSVENLQITLKAVNSAIGGILLPLAAIHDILAAMYVGADTLFDTLQWGFASLMKTLYQAEEAWIKLKTSIFDATDEEKKRLNELATKIESWTDVQKNAFDVPNVTMWTDNVVNGLINADEAINKMSKSADSSAKFVGKIVKETDKIVEGMDEAKEATDKTAKSLEKIEETKLELDKKQFEHDLDMAKLKSEQAHDKIMEELKLEAELDLAKYEAGVELAKIRANELADAYDAAKESTQGLVDMVTEFAEIDFSDMGWTEKFEIERYMRETQKAVMEMSRAQRELIEAQTRAMEIQNDQMERGELRPIEVSIDGAAPEWLRGLMESLFETIMIKASSEAFSCLCTGS